MSGPKERADFTSELISSQVRDGILFIEFRDLVSRNSFSVRAARDLRATLRSRPAGVGAVVFSAPGRVFCSGGNLSDYAAMAKPEEGHAVNREITSVLDELASLPLPTICVVTGDCFGGGVELASSFDRIVSAPQAYFGLWQRKIGLSFGWGGGKRLEKRLGLHALRRMAIEAATIGAQEALGVGLIDAIHLDADLMNEAERWARLSMSLPKTPVSGLKTFTSERELETFEALWWNEEHQRVLGSRKKP